MVLLTQTGVLTDMHSTAQQQNQAQGNRKMIFQAMTVQPATCDHHRCFTANDHGIPFMQYSAHWGASDHVWDG